MKDIYIYTNLVIFSMDHPGCCVECCLKEQGQGKKEKLGRKLQQDFRLQVMAPT
jgi:hypothetical protein